MLILISLLALFVSSCNSGLVDETLRKSGTELPEWAIGPFKSYEHNPVLKPEEIPWEDSFVIAPTITVRNNRFYMLYRGLDKDWHSGGVDQIGLAWSNDGVNWQRFEKNPVIKATEEYEVKGCQDPRLVKYDGTYYLTYTGWHHNGYDLCLATSEDLINWKKYGPLFQNIGSTKSGTIVQNPKNEAVRINGKFVMYILESYDTFHNDWIAYSDDLINWDIKKFSPKLGGESCVAITDYNNVNNDNIVLFYAGNLNAQADKVPWGHSESSYKIYYAINQALFSRDDPEKLIDVLKDPIIKPVKPFADKTWDVCMFSQAITRYKGKWWLYYGGCYPGGMINLATYDLKR